MSFLSVFVAAIEAAWSGATLYFQQPSGPTKPYVVLLLVPPNSEIPQVLCEEQGDGGELTLQWSCAADSSQEAFDILEALKAVLRGIRGEIGTAPDNYLVSANRVNGVQSFDAALGTWAAILEQLVQWDKVAA